MRTEVWKIQPYLELAFEVQCICQVEAVVVPLVIGALRTDFKDFVKWQENRGILNITGCTQMSALL